MGEDTTPRLYHGELMHCGMCGCLITLGNTRSPPKYNGSKMARCGECYMKYKRERRLRESRGRLID